MVTEIGNYMRKIRIRTGDSLRTMATKFGISAAYLSAVENGKRNISQDLLDRIYQAYSIPEEEQKVMNRVALNSISNYKVDLTTLTEKKRQLLVSVANERLDDETVDKLYEILKNDSSTKNNKL
jgi:transcriptional regulator with XRE-family HTH domain